MTEAEEPAGPAEASAPADPGSERDLTDFRVIVVGGGVAGLVAARDCVRPGIRVTLLEATGRFGGSVDSAEVAGVRVDVGAESFATRGGRVAELAADLGLGGDLVAPAAQGAWLQLRRGAVPAPKASLLGIPGSPLAADVIAAIGWQGAFRAYLDRIAPILKLGRVTNLGELVRRRMGARVHDELVAPVTTNVYGVRPDDVDVAAAAPGLNGALTRLGSLSGAVAELRGSGAKPGAAVGGIRGGMWRLAEALADSAREAGADLRTGVAVTGLAREHPSENEPEPRRWRVQLSDATSLAADAVILALPGPQAIALLGSLGTDVQNLDWPEPSTVELITLALDATPLDSHPRGTGVLVAEGAPGVTAKALTHSSAKWAWLAAAAGPGRHYVRASYGRPGEKPATAGLGDDAALQLALADAASLLGVTLPTSAVAGFARTAWTTALPKAALGQSARLAAVREAVDGIEGLEVTGAWLAGTGLASVVPDALAAAKNIRSLRWRSLLAEAGLAGGALAAEGDEDPIGSAQHDGGD